MPLIDHDSDVPVYIQLAGILRGQIERGEVTGRVPSAKTLAQSYVVAVGTAERALGILRQEGVIRSAMGRGHFVIKPE